MMRTLITAFALGLAAWVAAPAHAQKVPKNEPVGSCAIVVSVGVTGTGGEGSSMLAIQYKDLDTKDQVTAYNWGGVNHGMLASFTQLALYSMEGQHPIGIFHQMDGPTLRYNFIYAGLNNQPCVDLLKDGNKAMEAAKKARSPTRAKKK
jgi:hypothetical protein